MADDGHRRSACSALAGCIVRQEAAAQDRAHTQQVEKVSRCELTRHYLILAVDGHLYFCVLERGDRCRRLLMFGKVPVERERGPSPAQFRPVNSMNCKELGSATGRLRSNSPFAKRNTATLAAVPSATVSATKAVKTGSRPICFATRTRADRKVRIYPSAKSIATTAAKCNSRTPLQSIAKAPFRRSPIGWPTAASPGHFFGLRAGEPNPYLGGDRRLVAPSYRTPPGLPPLRSKEFPLRRSYAVLMSLPLALSSPRTLHLLLPAGRDRAKFRK